MGLITVGIHENLVLSKESKINEHGTLELVIESKQSADALLDAFTSNTTYSPMKSSIRFYPPSITNFDKTKGNKTASELAAELLKMRHQFMEYGKIFTTTDVVEKHIGNLEMFKGIGIPEDQIPQAIARLTNEEFLKKVVTNLSTKFLALLTEANAFGTIAFRQKFLRQSADKNFAVIPSSEYDTWIEPMEIPKSASKVAFSKWEIDNKKNDPNPGTVSSSETKAQDVAKGENLFGGANTAPQLSN